MNNTIPPRVSRNGKRKTLDSNLSFGYENEDMYSMAFEMITREKLYRCDSARSTSARPDNVDRGSMEGNNKHSERTGATERLATSFVILWR